LPAYINGDARPGYSTLGAGAIPGPGGTPGPLVNIPEGVTPGTPGPVGTTPGPTSRGEYPIPSLGSPGDPLRANGPVDDGGGGTPTEIDGLEMDARGGDVVSERGCDSPLVVGKRCGTGVWKRSGGYGPGASPGPDVQPCRGGEDRV